MVYRYTLDSATEFLFGHGVQSLSAGLPYPPGSPLKSSNSDSHPSNIFAHHFNQAQVLSALRPRRGKAWPLLEFWHNTVAPHRQAIDNYIDPILKVAMEKKRASGIGSVADMKLDRVVGEDETLLDHLVHYTEDQDVLRDEALNIMIAGVFKPVSTAARPL